ncbi:MAG: hypothetical protein KA291_02770 [Psychrobacter sp.]|nr:hypothetical protein [Psychrobacter sp.]
MVPDSLILFKVPLVFDVASVVAPSAGVASVLLLLLLFITMQLNVTVQQID